MKGLIKNLGFAVFIILAIVIISYTSFIVYAEPTFNSNSTFQSLNSTNINTFNYCNVCSYNFQINVTNSVNATFQLGSTNYTESAGDFIALIPFNEGSGNSSADIVNPSLYNMSLFNGFAWNSGVNCTWGNYQSGSCVSFDGSTGYGIVNNTQWLSNSSNFTIVLDLNTLTPSIDQERIFDMTSGNVTNGWQLIWQSPNSLQFVGRNGTGGIFATFTVTSSSNILNDTKYFVALEYNQYNGSAFMWINNIQKGDFFTNTSIIASTPTNLTIARRSVGVIDFANVTIDNLRIYNYSLTNAQVQNLYEAEHGGGSNRVVYSIYDSLNSSTKYVNFSSQPGGTFPIVWYATNNTNGQNFTNMGNLMVNPIISPLSIQFNSSNVIYNSQDWTNNFAYLNFTATAPLIWTGYQNNSLIENSTGLILRYSFDEGTGTTTSDSSGYGQIGYLKNTTGGGCFNAGCPTWVNGKFGSGIDFNNNTGGNFLTSKWTQNETATNVFTWSFWFYPRNSSDVLPRIINFGNSRNYLTIQQVPTNVNYGKMVLEITNSSQAAFDYYADGVNFSIPDNQNKWWFVAMTFNATLPVSGSLFDSPLATFYFNGTNTTSRYVSQIVNATIFGDILNTKGTNFTIGGNAAISREFNGTIDEIRVYNRILSPSEIASLYLEGATKFAVGTYNYILNTTGNQNYTSTTKSALLTVSKGNFSINAFLNNIAANLTTTSRKNVKIDANTSALSGSSDVILNLYSNNTLLTSGLPATYLNTFAVGTYNIIANGTGGQNYSAPTSQNLFLFDIVDNLYNFTYNTTSSASVSASVNTLALNALSIISQNFSTLAIVIAASIICGFLIFYLVREFIDRPQFAQ